MAALEQVITDLATAYAPVSMIRIESWQGIASGQRLTALGLPLIYSPPRPSIAPKNGPCRRIISPHGASGSHSIPGCVKNSWA